MLDPNVYEFVKELAPEKFSYIKGIDCKTTISVYKNLKTNKEEDLVVTDEKVITPGTSLMQKNRNTNKK